MLDFNFNYNFIYFFMSFCALFFISKKQSTKLNIFFIFIFTVIWIVLFGFRDFNVGSDTYSYLYLFNDSLSSSKFQLLEDSKDLGNTLFNYAVSRFITNEHTFIFIFDCLFLIPFVFAISNIKVKNTFLLFFIFSSFFFFKTMGINIMRQGVSISFFLLGLSFYFKNLKKISYIFFIVSLLFHVTILISLVFLYVSTKLKTPKYCIYLYIITIVISFFGFGYNFLISKFPQLVFLIDERFISYTNNEKEIYEVGFKLNFVVFNSIFAFIGYYLYSKGAEKSFKYYNSIFFTFLILSSNFFLTFDIPYSDRIGLLSWILVPFLLVPLINSEIVKYGPFKVFIFCIFIFIYFNIFIFL